MPPNIGPSPSHRNHYLPTLQAVRDLAAPALLGDGSRAAEPLRQALGEGYAFSAGVHRSWALLGLRDDPGVRTLLRPKD